MKISTFQVSWGTARAVAIGVAVALMLAGTVKSYCYTVEMDYTGPGSEAESLDRACTDRDNREAFERYHRDGDERDKEGAERYERDHSA